VRGTAFRSGVERNYPLPHVGPDARLSKPFVTSGAVVPVGYGFPRPTAPDPAVLESALGTFLYNSQENDR
jgi:hypothetical protein